ncbi:MAG: glycosyltransferase [Kiritimatiellaeota bacterium]|nr:glycosyltransferase [Kiritimatiellota bacterium]
MKNSNDIKSGIEYFDSIAYTRNAWIKRNNYYNRKIRELHAFHAPEGSRILEIGCGTGELLASLRPSFGLGIDYSPKMIEIASSKFPEIEFIAADADDFEYDGLFDFIIISDTAGYFDDIAAVFANLKKNCHSGTRLIVNFHNYLWEPFLRLLESLGMKMRQPFSSWLNIEDMTNILNLEDYEVIRSGGRLLFPMGLPLIAPFFNSFAAHLPLLDKLNLVNYIVAKPVAIPPFDSEHSVSVVIPARNESGNIEEAVKRTPEMGSGTEIIFVEGGSSDDTYAEIERVAEKYKNKRKILHAKQEGTGKGDAVRKGFSMASGDILMILDADLTVPPEDLPKFFKAISSGKGEFINGTRLVYPLEKESMRPLNILANKFFSLMFTWLLDQRFKDTLCGTKVISAENYAKLAENRSYFGDFDPFGDFDLLFGASKMSLKIVEVPVRYQARVYGETNISRFAHGWLLLKMCFYAMRKIKFL